MKPIDNVAIALEALPSDVGIEVKLSDNKSLKLTLKENISFGHKFAVKPIRSGEVVLKYGEVIGKAVRDITEGEHVHVHNLEGTRGRGDKVVTE